MNIYEKVEQFLRELDEVNFVDIFNRRYDDVRIYWLEDGLEAMHKELNTETIMSLALSGDVKLDDRFIYKNIDDEFFSYEKLSDFVDVTELAVDIVDDEVDCGIKYLKDLFEEKHQNDKYEKVNRLLEEVIEILRD